MLASARSVCNVDEVYVPCEVGVERLQIGNESLQVYLLDVHRLQLRHLAVALHERRQTATRVVYRLDALFERRSLHHLAADVRLRDALYRCHGVHYLVRQHACQPLPRLHLAARHQLVNLSAHLVEHLLQFALAGHDAVRRQAEHEVAVAQCLAHEVHTSGEATLVAPLKYEEHYEECGEKGNYIWCHVVMVRCCFVEML